MSEVEVKAEKIYKRELIKKIVKIALLLLLIIISIIYLVLYVAYQSGRFTVTLDRNLSNQKNVYLSEIGEVKDRTRHLSAETINYMDNISINWLPEDIDIESDGSHNGDNYIAYTFYVVNGGNETVHYWMEMDVDDTIKRVDEAIRIMIYRNGEPTFPTRRSSDLIQKCLFPITLPCWNKEKISNQNQRIDILLLFGLRETIQNARMIYLVGK